MPKKCARILIVEDMPTLSETYAAYLRADGHVIDTALSGRAALSILDVHIPDIIILDVNLPDMNGLEILRNVRQRNITADVLIITGQASVNLAIEAMKRGSGRFRDEAPLCRPVEEECQRGHGSAYQHRGRDQSKSRTFRNIRQHAW